MTHGLVIATIGGARHALRLTLPAYFAITDIGAVLTRLARGAFTIEDVRKVWAACHQGGPVAGLEAVEAAGVAGLKEAALWAAMAVSAGVTNPDGKHDGEGGEDVTLGHIPIIGIPLGGVF